MSNKKGLGRGIDHLINHNLQSSADNEIRKIKLDSIKPNPYQPRKHFDEQALNELAQSIKENGLFQPILVREGLVGYEIISGERRFRASKLAGLSEVPVIIYDYNDEQMMEVALVENIQREDLNILEEAKSYQMLMDNLNYTQEQLANKVGKSRSHVANIMRLLKLDANTQELVAQDKLTLGHVKTLITIDDYKKREQIVNKIINENLTVREVEELARGAKPGGKLKVKPDTSNLNTARNKRLEKIIREKINAQVKIKGENKGSIEFKFNSEDELENILEQLNLL